MNSGESEIIDSGKKSDSHPFNSIYRNHKIFKKSFSNRHVKLTWIIKINSGAAEKTSHEYAQYLRWELKASSHVMNKSDDSIYVTCISNLQR